MLQQIVTFLPWWWGGPWFCLPPRCPPRCHSWPKFWPEDKTEVRGMTAKQQYLNLHDATILSLWQGTPPISHKVQFTSILLILSHVVFKLLDFHKKTLVLWSWWPSRCINSPCKMGQYRMNAACMTNRDDTQTTAWYRWHYDWLWLWWLIIAIIMISSKFKSSKRGENVQFTDKQSFWL